MGLTQRRADRLHIVIAELRVHRDGQAPVRQRFGVRVLAHQAGRGQAGQQIDIVVRGKYKKAEIVKAPFIEK